MNPAGMILKGRSLGQPIFLEEYQKDHGYEGLEKALRNYSPKEVTRIVRDSGLRGHGGAGFPTGKKWSFLADDAPFPRFLVSNTDEMEPGTFKDRFLVSINPHVVIEGMAIAAYAASAETGFFFVRPSYEGPAEIFQKAMAEARKAGFLGKNILGTKHSFDIIIHRSGGRYICGEAKGLIHALEGERPHPNIEGHLTTEGLWGKPTVVNNVETLSHVPSILRFGAEWFRNQGSHESAQGTKLYAVSGKVKRPGVYELPFGTSLKEIIEGAAEGMLPGCSYKTCLPGGASTRFLPTDSYDVAMDFDSIEKLGQGYRFGTGAIMVFDQDTCLVAVTLNLIRFFARESCGWCTPCREGLPYMLDLLERIERGEGKMEYVSILQEMCGHMPKAYCAFAPGAAAPVEGLLENFADEVFQHISEKRCPFEAPKW